MSTLKDKFENYEKQPDEKVWQSIMDTMNNRVSTVRRRRIVMSASAVAVASVALLFAVTRSNDNSSVRQTNIAATEQVKIASVEVPDNLAADEQTSNTDVVRTADVKMVKTAETKVERKEGAVLAAVEQDYAIVNAVEEKSNEKNVAESVGAEKKDVSVQSREAVEPVQANKVDENKNNTSQNKVMPPKATAQDLVVWIPNAFSPDDPMNDDVRQFKVYPNSEANLLSYEIFIYSRGGRQVYHSKDVSQGWDGTFNGHKQPMGTYVYIIELNDAVKGLQHKKGTVTLIR